MTEVLKNLKPEKVFSFFEEISKIPRGSGDEKAISDYLVNFAKERNLEVIQDEANNIIIKKNGSKGYENAPTVVLQGHMDMVCEKNKSTEHDFEKDPIDIYVDGDFVKARGTTLGADNGIAVAYSIAILDSDDIAHPPLEVLITTDEENGMSGAMALKAENIKGRTLINIDSEEEGELLVSCAGGIRTKVILDINWEDATDGTVGCYLKVRGLKGGHSGMDISKERANANRVLARVLMDLLKNFKFDLGSLNGGAKNNAIPREADAELKVFEKDKEALIEKVAQWNKILLNEYKNSDGGIRVELEFDNVSSEKVFSSQCKEKAIKLMYLIPNGVYSMSTEIGDLVQSSTNLGVVTTNADTVTYDSLVRSSIKSLKYDILNETIAIAEAFGSVVTTSAEYPEWQYDDDSKIRQVFQRVYKEMYKEEPKVVAIHAGVECGLFKEKFGDIDMISFGPNMFDVHTPDERLSISSTERTWNYLLAVLKELNK